MTKARTLADFISDGSPLADGTISVSEVSGAAPLASPTFTGTITSTGDIALGDLDELILGSNKMRLYYDNNNNYTVLDSNGTQGFRFMGTTNLSVELDGSAVTSFSQNGVVISPNGTEKLQVYSGGSIFSGNLKVNDDIKLGFGQFGTDLEIYHDAASTTNKLVGDLTQTGAFTTDKYNNAEALPTVRPSLLLDFANSKTLDPRITFTRGSTATYWDGKTTTKAEENLTFNGLTLTGTGWTNSNGMTVTPNAGSAPDGTTTATQLTLASGKAYYQTVSNIGAATYTASVYVKQAASGSATQFRFATNNTQSWSSGGTASVTLTSSWQRVTITGTLTGGVGNMNLHMDGSQLNGNIDSNSVGNVLIWGAQVELRSSATAFTPTTSNPIVKYQPTLQTAASGEARFDHDPVTGESKGLLIEEARTNLIPYSNFTNSSGFNNIFKVGSSIAPDGTQTATILRASADTQYCYTIVSGLTLTQNTTYTYSVFVKAANSFAPNYIWLLGNTSTDRFNFIDPSTGTLGTSASGVTTKVEDVGNGWYRCAITFTNTQATGSQEVGLGFAQTNGTPQSSADETQIEVWGEQLEVGSFPTSYIPTSGSTVTRSADHPNVTDLSWFNNQEGSFSMEGATLPSLSTTGFYSWWSIEGDTSGEENRLIFYNNNRLYYQSSASTYSAAGSVPRDGTFFKASGSFKYGDSISAPASFDGVSAEYTGANGPKALQPDILRIGRSRGDNYPVSGHIKKLAFFTKQLNQTTLNAMTEE